MLRGHHKINLVLLNVHWTSRASPLPLNVHYYFCVLNTIIVCVGGGGGFSWLICIKDFGHFELHLLQVFLGQLQKYYSKFWKVNSLPPPSTKVKSTPLNLKRQGQGTQTFAVSEGILSGSMPRLPASLLDLLAARSTRTTFLPHSVSTV